jgi:hypothetical protein
MVRLWSLQGFLRVVKGRPQKVLEDVLILLWLLRWKFLLV